MARGRARGRPPGGCRRGKRSPPVPPLRRGRPLPRGGALRENGEFGGGGFRVRMCGDTGAMKRLHDTTDVIDVPGDGIQHTADRS